MSKSRTDAWSFVTHRGGRCRWIPAHQGSDGKCSGRYPPSFPRERWLRANVADGIRVGEHNWERVMEDILEGDANYSRKPNSL